MTVGSLSLARRGVRAIQVLRGLRGEPTGEERDALAQWPGWGPLAPALDPHPGDAWSKITDDLYAAMEDDPDALRHGKEAVDNAFYTSPLVVDSIWSLVTAAGFTGGRVLEPGCGTGRFFDRLPSLAEPVELVGVERDPVTARIAAALHPEARIITAALEETPLRAGSFDLAIGNVPFSRTGVFDHAFDFGKQSLHTYFVARSLAAVRHGGYVALVVSRYLLDTPWITGIADHPEISADFVGAIRLPTGTFRGEGTNVVADVVLLRRNSDPHASIVEAPAAEVVHTYYGGSVSTSCYWRSRPAHIAGTVTFGDHHARPLQVTAVDHRSAITEAAAALRGDLLPYLNSTATPDFADVTLTDPLGRKENSFHLTPTGDIIQIRAGRATPARRSRELAALIKIRDAMVELTAAEADNTKSDTDLKPVRAAARQAWETYVAAYGPVNRGHLTEAAIDPDTDQPRLGWKRPLMGGFRADPDFVTVLAAEDYDPDTQTAAPAAILIRRVNRPPVPITSAQTAAEALAVTLGETGTVDVDRIADLLRLPPAAVPAALGDLVYADPEADAALTPARTYLSGNVRRKLAAARSAAAADPGYGRNVAALQEILPTDLGPLDIEASFGMPWITPTMIKQFIADVLDISAHVDHEPATAAWEVNAHARSAVAVTTYGTPRLNAVELIRCALNGKAPIVYDEVPGDGPWGRTRRVRNPEETLAAQDKLSALQDRFGVWIWEDQDRSDTICRVYNERLNSHVTRRADGSHLRFPTADGVTLWPWQQDIVEQIISSPATFCAHAVGSGKTLSMISSAIMLRQLGLAQKPMIVVPNHLLEQISREARQTYPTGRFLIADKEALAGDKRRLFAARCATGDWDAVIITHASFGSIPVSPHTEQEWILEQKADLEDALRANSGYSFGSKEIARRLRSLGNQLSQLRASMGDPRTICFEHLGVDFVGVDEAHCYKRLSGPGMITSRAEGFTFGVSKRATDLYLKIGHLRRRSQGRPYVAFFSGTPWTNSLAETFVWQKYLQPDLLEETGLANFDAWASVFVKRETKVEIAPDGNGFRIATRPTALTNVPELRSLFLQCADVLPSSDLPLTRPDLDSETIVVEQTPGQAAFVADLVRRADVLRTTRVDPKNDNMLRVCGEGRRVALDPHLVGLNEDSPKLAAIADRIAAIHHETRGLHYGNSPTPGAFQLVFCDLGTPTTSGDGQTYGRLRTALITRGIPGHSIRFVHEAATDHAKAALFAACRDGHVSVLIGSTDKVGMGTNVQTRLIAMHHLDAPWRPSDVEQRIGRGQRSGNLNPTVRSITYITARTFDAYMWQALERKSRFIAQMMRTDLPRTVDDISDVELDYAHVKSLATGNPLVLEHAQIAATVKRLRTLRALDAQAIRSTHRSAHARAEAAERALPKAARYEAAAAALTNPIDERGLRRFAERVHDAARGRSGPSGSWDASVAACAWRTDLQIQIVRDYRHDSSRPDLALRITRRYHELDQVVLSSGALARSLTNAANVLRRTLEAWEARLPDMAEQIRRDHAEAQSEMATADALLATYRFSRHTELLTAERRLAEIEAEMETGASHPSAA